MDFKLVIFDLDGTLIDSLEGIGLSMNIVLRRIGAPVHTLNQYRSFIGDGIVNFVKRSLPQDRLDIDFIDQCIRDYKSTYKQIWPRCTAPFPGMLDVIKELNRRDIQASILSNKSEKTVQEIARQLFPGCRFDPVWGSKEGIPNKPDPYLTFKILNHHHLSVDQALFVGDSGIDIRTAQRSGIQSVGVSWGISPLSELIKFFADFIIHHPRELLNILDNKYFIKK